MDTTQLILRILILIMAAATVALGGAAWRRRPSVRVWTWAPVSWAAHVAAFYVVLLWGNALPEQLNLWSSALRVHESILVLVGVWLFLWPARRNG